MKLVLLTQKSRHDLLFMGAATAATAENRRNGEYEMRHHLSLRQHN
jgi:hypothetical protein